MFSECILRLYFFIGVSPEFLLPFLSLMREKGGKEDQEPRALAKLAGYPVKKE